MREGEQVSRTVEGFILNCAFGPAAFSSGTAAAFRRGRGYPVRGCAFIAKAMYYWLRGISDIAMKK